MVKNHHKSRFYPNYKGRPEDSLSVVSSNQRKKLLVAGGCKLDGNETQELAKIREQRKDVGCLCSVTPGMGKGRTCRDAKLCECAANVSFSFSFICVLFCFVFYFLFIFLFIYFFFFSGDPMPRRLL